MSSTYETTGMARSTFTLHENDGSRTEVVIDELNGTGANMVYINEETIYDESFSVRSASHTYRIKLLGEDGIPHFIKAGMAVEYSRPSEGGQNA
jgi:hypothetical protein